MDSNTCSLFERVAKKMGWMETGGLDLTEAKLISTIGKSRHPGTSESKCGSSDDSENDDDDGDKNKENVQSKVYRVNVPIVSSDDDFEQFLKAQTTPKTQTQSLKPVSSSRKESVAVVSSDSEGTFETFLERVKTPCTKSRTITKNQQQDDLRNFIVNESSSDDDDFADTKSARAPRRIHTPSQVPLQRPLSQFDSPVFVSDSDDEEDKIVIKSTWKTRHAIPLTSSSKKKGTTCHNDSKFSPSVAAKSVNLLTSDLNNVPNRTHSAPSRLDDSASSEEEFASLLDRLKKKNILQGGSPLVGKADIKPDATPSLANSQKSSGIKLLNDKPHKFVTPSKKPIKPTVSQTEPHRGPVSKIPLCKTPGCFLETLSNPGSTYGRNFKQNKEELTSRLFTLYNATVFDKKLPESMSVTWNKKMRKTAGYCVTGQERGGGNHYARIELSEKVCDSADRLRDTLIHEMCHAATWLINGVRDGHGNFWKLYARKSTVVHPELPMVTRCHSYDINFKFQYQCTRCQNKIGRHSKSLDTERFVCAICTGKLVLLNPSAPRTPTPFANFVKENYGSVKKELVGKRHADVMRKLSADFALKTKLSQS